MTYDRPPILAVTRAVPGAGKSHWANATADLAAHPVKTVSLDDLRQVIDRNDGSREFDRTNENFIQSIEAQIAVEAIEAGHDVIVHDTNIFAKRPNLLRRLTAGICDTIVVDFTDVNVALCHARNNERANPVPAEVIDRMAKEERKGRAGFKGWTTVTPDEARGLILDGTPKVIELPPYVPNLELPMACLVDLDGTLAKIGNRNPYDSSRYAEDKFDRVVWAAACGFPYVVFLSGRDDEHRAVTEAWLLEHIGGMELGFKTGNPRMIPELYMRPTGDKRPDAIVKRELFMENVAPRYNVRASFDDRDSVVAMWRRIGLPCLQVAPGRF